ncbi:SDR family NAD(P)-dependent oxidoreductase [Trebonia sp.]|uniref:SDR family NAD(P)-dependent oxidoreductase n=1 Tax=Trebonia sp. TaxID=2767075 RepID=UPI002635D0EA|nr:SDR family oxidoreductase [Trebonia sp.]
MGEDMFDLTGKVAVITGGSRGLGRELALGMSRAGADVVIASRKLANCETAARAITAETGRRAMPYALHAGRWNEAEPFVDAVYDEFGRCDVLVNNAGMSPHYDKLTDVSEQLFDSVVNLNFKGPFRLSVLFGEHMKAAGSGSIINISSTASVRPPVYALPYAGAKAGLNALTEGLAKAYGPEVRVNTIMAGMMRTDIAKSWDEEIAQADARLTALKRIADPAELLGAALLLASGAGSYISGATLRADGGIP